MILQSAPCHKDYIHTLGSKIGAWEGGQKIGQTDRQTDKSNYNIDGLRLTFGFVLALSFSFYSKKHLLCSTEISLKGP